MDARVWTVERCNARELTPASFAAAMSEQKRAFDLTLLGRVAGAVMDLSFISVLKVLPAIQPLLAPGAWMVVLIKPQFEAGRSAVQSGGLVTEPGVLEPLLLGLWGQIELQGLRVRAMCKASIKGSDGNQEFLFWLECP